ncbi:MAG: NAD(P)H-dependent oxidoreductase subunit E, partial [Planctomycetes bacterium]|nr:NAD(P)H-dependent oxidoreductase subunit E [Planctomycetota bacterium]
INTVKQELNVQEGQTTDDMEFTFETVACLGVCALAPVTVIDSTYYGKMTPRRARTVLAGLRADREETD